MVDKRIEELETENARLKIKLYLLQEEVVGWRTSINGPIITMLMDKLKDCKCEANNQQVKPG